MSVWPSGWHGCNEQAGPWADRCARAETHQATNFSQPESAKGSYPVCPRMAAVRWHLDILKLICPYPLQKAGARILICWLHISEVAPLGARSWRNLGAFWDRHPGPRISPCPLWRRCHEYQFAFSCTDSGVCTQALPIHTTLESIREPPPRRLRHGHEDRRSGTWAVRKMPSMLKHVPRERHCFIRHPIAEVFRRVACPVA